MEPLLDARYIGRIPVRNIWLLMLYASELSRFGGIRNVTLEPDREDLPDLVARLLVRAVELRVKRNLTRGYRHRESTLKRVRGRIDVLRTEAQCLLDKGEIFCRFDELTIDTPRNRLIRAALELMTGLVRNRDLVQQCRFLSANLARAGVGGCRPSHADLARETIGRNDSSDRLVVALANLAFELSLPSEEAGPVPLPEPDREERWVRKLFEKAILGFARAELEPLGWRVRGAVRLNWHCSAFSEGIPALLPGMELDIVLDSPFCHCPLIIDTKFTSILGVDRFGTARFKSGYLYQMYAYLRSQPAWKDASGLFIHPALDAKIEEHVVVQGHRVTFATVDLSSSPEAIRGELRDILNRCVPMSK